MPFPFDPARVRTWFGEVHRDLQQYASRLNAANVFPVCDHDTGTNLCLTWDGVMAGLERAEPGATGPRLVHSGAKGALVAARGNAGTIMAGYLLGFAAGLEGGADLGPVEALASALARADHGARLAVAEPREGTFLSVSAALADESARLAGEGLELEAVIAALSRRAHAALAETEHQLDALRKAGVIDAGACALAVFIDALARVTPGAPPPPAPESWLPGPDPYGDEELDELGEFEIMFLLHGSLDAVERARTGLCEVGNSVVIAGGPGSWHVHVHTRDVERALQVGKVGQRRQVVVRHIATVHPEPDLGLVVLTRATAMVQTYAQAGSVVLLSEAALPQPDEIARAVADTPGREVAIVAGDPELADLARAAIGASASGGTHPAPHTPPQTAGQASSHTTAPVDDEGIPAAPSPEVRHTAQRERARRAVNEVLAVVNRMPDAARRSPGPLPTVRLQRDLPGSESRSDAARAAVRDALQTVRIDRSAWHPGPAKHATGEVGDRPPRAISDVAAAVRDALRLLGEHGVPRAGGGHATRGARPVGDHGFPSAAGAQRTSPSTEPAEVSGDELDAGSGPSSAPSPGPTSPHGTTMHPAAAPRSRCSSGPEPPPELVPTSGSANAENVAIAPAPHATDPVPSGADPRDRAPRGAVMPAAGEVVVLAALEAHQGGASLAHLREACLAVECTALDVASSTEAIAKVASEVGRVAPGRDLVTVMVGPSLARLRDDIEAAAGAAAGDTEVEVLCSGQLEPAAWVGAW